ncbi:MAG: basic rane protein [Gammaproteobacteria bacterium]|jgi:simple sugar transport system substrate-binding protein|nr:basic rane protein [Gammaproteobacteria bacterium]
MKQGQGSRRAVVAALFGTLATGVLTVRAAEEPIKVAFVYVDPVGDTGWSYQHDVARRELERVLGSKVKTTFVESVPATADAERVIRQLAVAGNQLIFTTSFGYMEPSLRVAKQFPSVKFEHATGYKTAANVVTYETRFYEGAYLLGVLAGKTTKSNTLGFVASFPIPEVIRNIDAFTLGARSVNPKATTKVIWVDTWYDPGKERQAAEALVAQGADVLGQDTDSPAIVQVAEKRGVHAFGWDSDMSKYGPNAQLTANTENWSDYYIDEVRKVMAGTWTGGRHTAYGIKEKMVVLTPLNKSVPADVARLFEDRQREIADGKLAPFAGPIKDNTGAVKLAAGSQLTHEQLMAINWYVEGVDGSIPQ